MRIDAISNSNCSRGKNLNFGELVFVEKTLQTMESSLNMKETDAMRAAAEDKIDLRELLNPTDIFEKSTKSGGKNVSKESLIKMVEKVLLENSLASGSGDCNVKLLYEPFVDARYTKAVGCDPWGLYEGNRLYHYGLGGRFKFLNFLPPLPNYANHTFGIEGEKGVKPLTAYFLDFDKEDSSRLWVKADTDVCGDVEAVKETLGKHGFIPNETCPVPTKEFVRKVVKETYEYLIRKNVAQMTDLEKSTLDIDLKKLRESYAARRLANFIFTV